MVQTSLNSDVKLAQNLPAIKDELNLIYGIYKNELTINIGKSNFRRI